MMELPGINIHPMPGLTFEIFTKTKELMVDLLYGRLYSTEEKVNYVTGDFPKKLVSNFDKLNGLQEKASKKPHKFSAYHGHRESLYAIGKFLGIDFSIHWPGLPTRSIPAASALIWELHHKDEA